MQSYVDKSKCDAQPFIDAMAAETWYTAEEAVEAGLADTITDFAGVAACYEAPWVNVPDRILERIGNAAPKEPDPTEEQIQQHAAFKAQLSALKSKYMKA